MSDRLADPRIRCCAELEPNRACWRPVPLYSRRPLCADHGADPSARVSLRLARWARSEHPHRADRWRGQDDVPWE